MISIRFAPKHNRLSVVYRGRIKIVYASINRLYCYGFTTGTIRDSAISEMDNYRILLINIRTSPSLLYGSVGSLSFSDIAIDVKRDCTDIVHIKIVIFESIINVGDVVLDDLLAERLLCWRQLSLAGGW